MTAGVCVCVCVFSASGEWPGATSRLVTAADSADVTCSVLDADCWTAAAADTLTSPPDLDATMTAAGGEEHVSAAVKERGGVVEMSDDSDLEGLEARGGHEDGERAPGDLKKDEQGDDDDDEEERQVRTSPNGRFLKFDKNIGRGSFKTVFKGLDTETGVHVAWCELQVSWLHALLCGRDTVDVVSTRVLANTTATLDGNYSGRRRHTHNTHNRLMALSPGLPG